MGLFLLRLEGAKVLWVFLFERDLHFQPALSASHGAEVATWRLIFSQGKISLPWFYFGRRWK